MTTSTQDRLAEVLRTIRALGNFRADEYRMMGEALRAHDAEKAGAQGVCDVSKRLFTIHGDQWHKAALPPIERDEDYERDYIPLPGGWEVQTKGRGSSFRICDTKTGERINVPDERVQAEIERMAREIREATAPLLAPEGWRTNYICDRECEPRCVTFADGRVVRVIGDGYLEIERAPS